MSCTDQGVCSRLTTSNWLSRPGRLQGLHGTKDSDAGPGQLQPFVRLGSHPSEPEPAPHCFLDQSELVRGKVPKLAEDLGVWDRDQVLGVEHP